LKKKDDFITIRTNIEWKQEITEKLKKDKKFDNLSHATRTLLNQYLSGELTPGESAVSFGMLSDDIDKILSAIKESENNIIDKLHSLPHRFLQNNTTDQLNQIIDDILSDLNLVLAKNCRNDVELAAIFKYDFQRNYVYDVIKRLEQEQLVSYRKDKLYWRNQEEN